MVDRSVFVAEWAQRVATGSASLFVGAGISMAAGYPSWRRLLHKVGEELGLDIDQEHDLAAVAQHYVNKNRGRSRLTQAIANEFPRKAPPEVLRVAARLPLRRIWTTNWDELIETALLDGRLEPDVKERSGDLTYERLNADVSVYKMHGSVRHLDDIVLATDDFELYRIRREAFLRALAGHLISTSFLFIGVSFTDPNLSHLLGGIREMFERYAPGGGVGQSHYAILRRPSASDFLDKPNADAKLRTAKLRYELFVEDLKRYNIHCVDIDEHSEIETILTEVEQRVALRAVFVSGSLAEGALPLSDAERVREIARVVGRVIGDSGKQLVSGYGLGLGDHVLSGMLSARWIDASSNLDRRVTIRPFPQQIQTDVDRAAFNRRYRQDLVARGGVCLVVCGLRVRSDGSGFEVAPGVREEVSIAQQMGRIVIPIAASFGAAQELAEELNIIADARYGQLPQSALQVLADAQATPEAIGKALETLLRALQA